MTINIKRFKLEFHSLSSCYVCAFGYEVFKQPGDKMILSKDVATLTSWSL